MLIINEVKCSLNGDSNAIIKSLCHKLKCSFNDIADFKILKRSIDARQKNDELQYVYQLLVTIKNEERYLRYPFVKKYEYIELKPRVITKEKTVNIIGYGPSGIFATYRLAQAGFKVKVFERGPRISKRRQKVDEFFKNGILDPNANVQFGEGGAGTFSDAKLTTRIKHPLIDYILDIFVENGANENIKIYAHPHIGTDVICEVISNITNQLMTMGVEFHFEEPLIDFIIENDTVLGIKTATDTYYSDITILAAGHSAFDIAQLLKKYHVDIKAKDMAIGFRVEHPQSLIDHKQYHDQSLVNILGAAEYFLRFQGERGVYSFCMCPGGIVVPSSSEEHTIVTNGMSYAARNSGIANSAILIQVSVADYQSDDPLAGFYFLQHFEKLAYEKAGSYQALAMNIEDYINNELHPLKRLATYPLGTTLSNLNAFFPKELNDIFKQALLDFDRKIPGFISEGIMIAPETRSSSPIRITRNIDGEAVNTRNLYPIGEGSGYGGGIMSCALDGVKVADLILKKFI